MELKDNYTFQAGMPINMAEISEKSKNISYDGLLAHAIANTNACVISNNKGQMVYVVPILGHNLSFLDLNVVTAKGWTVDIYTTGEKQYTALTNSYWSCGCKMDNVHHKILPMCLECGKTSMHRSMNYVEDMLHEFFQWKFIVGE